VGCGGRGVSIETVPIEPHNWKVWTFTHVSITRWDTCPLCLSCLGLPERGVVSKTVVMAPPQFPLTMEWRKWSVCTFKTMVSNKFVHLVVFPFLYGGARMRCALPDGVFWVRHLYQIQGSAPLVALTSQQKKMRPSSDTGVQKLCQLQSHSSPMRCFVAWKVTLGDVFVCARKTLARRRRTTNLTAMLFYILGIVLHKNPVERRQPVVGFYIKYLHLIHTENEWKINPLKRWFMPILEE
jgi:hypothetical protein